MTVLAATAWNTNADLILDCRKLGYLSDTARILDPTFGRGIWWKEWRPKGLITADLHKPADVQADFRQLPFPNDEFDAVAFDPPYVSIGGRTTTGLGDFHDRFGLTNAPLSPAGVQELINDGLTELQRVLKPRGVLLVKCQDYVSSGKLWIGTHHTLTHALALNFEVLDRLEHLAGVRPQPAGRRQVHARRNISTLFVLRNRKDRS